MKNEKVKNEKVKWFILDWKVLKVMHQQTLNLHELVSLMDVAWLSIESIVSYYWQWEQSLVMELQSSSLLHCQHYYLFGMSSTCVCICPGCMKPHLFAQRSGQQISLPNFRLAYLNFRNAYVIFKSPRHFWDQVGISESHEGQTPTN